MDNNQSMTILQICWSLDGACGFGEFGRTVNDGSVSGVSRLYRNGTGCGACYQVPITI